MKLLGTKEIETDRLILKIPTMKEQKILWEILMIPEVNRYYLDINKKFKDRLLNWEIQKKFYEEKVNHAKYKDKFEWSIFLKNNGECIGQINSHISSKECDEENTMSLGWYFNPKYQKRGYATEAALAMINYMFNEVNLKKYKTSAAIPNIASWKLMEKLGFIRDKNKTIFNEYTFVDEPVESYIYELNKDKYSK